MRTGFGKILLLLSLSVPGSVLAWGLYGAWLASGIPKVELREVSPIQAEGERSLPFFELMSPLPIAEGSQALPKLEYKKGPPERFLERISVLFQANPSSPKERIVYHGRRTRTDLYGLSAFSEEPAREARYLEAALKISQGNSVPELEGLQGFLFRPLFLREASRWLKPGVTAVSVMDQSGTPAFLFEEDPGEGGRTHATALFVRRGGFYRVDYFGDRGFSLVEPSTLFRKTFLTEKRSDALEFLARNLSEVRLENNEEKSSLGLHELAWPILLLAANVSVDPSSLDSYFHFAGINALLYRSGSGQGGDLEVSDAMRNNVLASDLYARDVAPEAPKTLEIDRLARLLTRNFDQ